MNMIEHNDSQITKERNEIEQYLMRIIQRYFDIERQYSRESTEAIIVESLTRFKQSLLKECDSIFNLNGEAGNITLTIQKLEGEPAFEKRTAFNKDFGTEADTICEGNDKRLSNKRKPLPHVHEIADVEGLKELLDELVVSHLNDVHNNQSVLDMIRYSGKRAEIDLIELEFLETAVNRYYENLEYLEREVQSIHRKKSDDFAEYKDRIQEYLNHAQIIVQTSISWLDKAKEYAELKTESMRTWYESLISKFVTKQQLQKLEEHFSKAVRFITDGWIPLHDGKPVLNQKEDTGTTAGNGDGDSLQKIFNEGIRMGNDDWIWDNSMQSFVYQHNEENSYPLFLSLSKFQDYTHRVTLASSNADNDGIGIILAYDESTGNHLSLIVHTGGLSSAFPQAGIVFNYVEPGYSSSSGYYLRPVDNTLLQGIASTGSGWNALTDGVSVLIKRKGNNIKIWLKYNQPHGWTVVDKDIEVTDTPLFDFNLEDYPDLACFMDKECKYGYGCFSQPKATFLDVFFASYTNYMEPFGETIIDQQTHEAAAVPADKMNNVESGRIKMWFCHDKPDGTTERFPLPYLFLTENNSWGVIQGTYDDNSNIDISVNITVPVSGLITSKHFYDNRTIIVPIGAKEIHWGNVLDNNICNIYNNSGKLNFIKSLIKQDTDYWILNTSMTTNDIFGEFLYDYLDIINNGTLRQSDKDYCCYISEYKIKYLSEYFTNPRIYYQVYGEKRC